ncbi:hypothetical protein EON65_25970 [archaeon]|nr:MAG: hypothetical protein EON65_25970 [archaeon]
MATLRKIEVFLGLPCFDFSSVAVTSGGIVRRKPSSKEGWIEGIKDYAHSLFNLVGLVELVPIASRRVGGRELLAMTPVSFQREMKDKFKEEVEELKDMLKSLPQQSVALPSTPLEVLDDWI